MSITRSKIAATLGAAGIVGAILFAPMSASAATSAYPTNCNTWRSGNTASAVCYGGGGAYQAVAACETWNWLGQRLTKSVSGPVRAIGSISSVSCPSSHPNLYSYGKASYQ